MKIYNGNKRINVIMPVNSSILRIYIIFFQNRHMMSLYQSTCFRCKNTHFLSIYFFIQFDSDLSIVHLLWLSILPHKPYGPSKDPLLIVLARGNIYWVREFLFWGIIIRILYHLDKSEMWLRYIKLCYLNNRSMGEK